MTKDNRTQLHYPISIDNTFFKRVPGLFEINPKLIFYVNAENYQLHDNDYILVENLANQIALKCRRLIDEFEDSLEIGEDPFLILYDFNEFFAPRINSYIKTIPGIELFEIEYADSIVGFHNHSISPFYSQEEMEEILGLFINNMHIDLDSRRDDRD